MFETVTIDGGNHGPLARFVVYLDTDAFEFHMQQKTFPNECELLIWTGDYSNIPD